MNALPDIPRLYTALAEWAACMVCVLVQKRRQPGKRFAAGCAIALIVQGAVQALAGALPLALWLPGMAAAVGAMFFMIFALSRSGARDAAWCCAGAFTLAEFAASLGWQLYCFFFRATESRITLEGAVFTLAVYAAVFVPMYFFGRRHREPGGRIDVLPGELWTVAIMALATFLVSNISFVTVNTPFSSRLVPELLYIRTLVDFGGLVLIASYQEQRREARLESELKAIQGLLRLQFSQYQQSRESIDAVNRRYHDLKHQIAAIRAEGDPARRAACLDEMDSEIRSYESRYKTGNTVVDTILAAKDAPCKTNGISITCVADGALLDFMDVMDICSIFGNALDNAIESLVKVEEAEKRLLRIALYSQNSFILIRFENWFEGELRMDGELPASSKTGGDYHGFGLKSIRHAAEKYAGTMTVNVEDHWFILRLLIPRREGSAD